MHTATRPLLEIRGITKRFPGVLALDDVSVALAPREGHALLGENGAGKSTLMNIVAGLFQPDAGEIFINGTAVVIDSPVTAQRHGIGMVPQELTLAPQLSIMENICLGMLPTRAGGTAIDWRKAETIAVRALAEMGEDFDVRRPVGSLGGAQQQIVQIARSFAFGAKMLILDEPTASLTDRETEKLFKTVSLFREAGGSFFYISHRLEEIKRICDRMTILRDGKKIVDLPVAGSNVREIVKHMVGRDMEPPPTRKVRGNSPVVLNVEGLTRTNEFTDVSFSLQEGEILGFAGLVGAGRTEIMRCIIGDTQPESGTVYFGTDLRRVSFRHPRDSIRQRIAYLPEERRTLGIFPRLSVRENMAITVFQRVRKFLGIDRKRVESEVERYVRELSIRLSSPEQMIQDLSGGNQ